MVYFGLSRLSVNPGNDPEMRMGCKITKHLYVFRMDRLVSGVFFRVESPN